MRAHALQLLVNLEDAINQKDLDAAGNCIAEQAILVNILGQRLCGREQICDYLAGYALPHRGEYLRYRLAHGFAVNHDCAVLNVQQICVDRADNRSSGITAAPLWVIRRSAEGWQIVAANTL